MNFPTVCESGAESVAECGANFTLVFILTYIKVNAYTSEKMAVRVHCDS